MSSPDSESSISEISRTLPIPKLIKILSHTFLVRDFNEVQDILMDRENNMKKEIEILTRDRDSEKDKIRLLERDANLSELERSNFEKKSQQNRRKIEELEETIQKLLEEKRVSNPQNSEMVVEKNKSIFELNQKINELETKNMENERLIGVYKENCKCLDSKVVKMGREIEDLRHERLGATQTVEELRRKLSEVENVVEGLKCKNVEANRTVEELRLKKLESDKTNEYNKIRVEKLAPRVMKIEELLADMLNVKVGGLSNLVGDMCKLATLEGGNLNFQYSKGKKQISGTGSTVGDAENMAVVSPRVRSASNSVGSKSIGLSNKGDSNLAQFSTGEDVARTLKTSPQAENNECKEPLSSGSDAAENETNLKKKFVHSPFSSLGSKRNRTTHCEEDLLANLVTKRTRNMFTTKHNDNCVPVDAPLEIFNDLNDEDSTDSDESCSDAAIDDLVASLGSNQLQRKFMYEADMLRALQENEELCMNAVCALYRQQIFAGKSTECRNSSGNEGFSPVDSMSGCTVAEYLIDGDKELRLRKSVAEVKKQRPDVISQCRKLANIYIEKLFDIYCSGKDPLFGR